MRSLAIKINSFLIHFLFLPSAEILSHWGEGKLNFPDCIKPNSFSLLSS